jgi:tetratricopeptide (TPR) repeat protein
VKGAASTQGRRAFVGWLGALALLWGAATATAQVPAGAVGASEERPPAQAPRGDARPAEAPESVTLTPDRLDRIRGLLLGRRFDEAQAALAPVKIPPDPWQMQEIGSLWAWAGDAARAKAAVRGLGGTKAAELMVARAILGDADPYGDGVAGMDPDRVCSMATMARYLLDMDRADLAARLGHDIRVRLPDCLEAWKIELFALTRAERTAEADAVMGEALAAHPDDVAVLRAVANHLRANDRLMEAADVLEKAVRLDPQGQGLLREWLSAALRNPADRGGLVERMEAKLAADPADPVTQFFVGVMAHYDNDFERSNALLAPLETVFGDEQRLHIYRAMNDFNLGKREAALERLRAQLTRAYVDPDIFYCLAEILRDSERAAAIGWLKRYIQESGQSQFANAGKVERVEQMVAALEGCMADGTAECDGPWEHPRAAMRQKLLLGWALMALGGALVLAGLWWAIRRRGRGRA